MSAAEATGRASPVPDAEAARLFASLADEPALVLAVSGGPDSTALLVLAARWRKHLKKRPKLLAVTIDHGLRAESGREAAAVKRLAGKLGVPHRTVRWTGRKPTTGLQAKAREQRYTRLLDAARRAGARCIVTAHTLDDQAETVLIRMARGSGLTGLAAMAGVTPMGACFVVRPFLDLPKARLVATLQAAGIPFAEDPSNRDPRFTRARLRHLLPALAQEGLEARRLAVLARRLRRADAALEAAADEAAARLARRSTAAPAHAPIDFDRAGFARLPEEVALRLLGRAITQVGDEGPVELNKLESLTLDLRSALAGPGGARFRRTLAGALVALGERLSVERAPPRRPRKAPASRRDGKGRPK